MKVRLPWLFSILAHIGILILLMTLSPHSSFRLNTSSPNSPVVHASVINNVKVTEQPKTVDQQPTDEQRDQLKKEVEQQKILQMRQLAAAKEQEQKFKEAKRQEEIAKALSLAQAKLAAEKKQKELAQAKADAEKKQREQQQLAEAKAAVEAKALAEKKVKDLQAAQAKQQELLAKQQVLQEQLMQQQIANERQELVKAQQMRGVVDQYRARILMAIASQWVIPDETDPAIFCVFSIQLNSQGGVSHVQLIKSSGNSALDRAAETAIYKASPLPVPKDPQIFAPFRKFTLKMTPQDVQ